MLSSILLGAGAILLVVFLLGFCIFIHEFGHLVVALWRGLHVEKFSVGFGRKLWGFTRGGVDYVVSVLPFGGYVALPQLDPSDKPVDTRDGRPLPQARPIDRMLTAFAGPFFNILFGFLLAGLLWWIGVWKPVPADEYVVHQVQADSAEAEAGLRAGDAIRQINGRQVPPSWFETVERLVLSTGVIELGIVREGRGVTIAYEAVADPENENLPMPRFQVREPVVVEQLTSGFPAEQAGLQVNDRLLSVNAKPVLDPLDFVDKIRATQGAPVTVEYSRAGGPSVFVTLVPAIVVDEGATRHLIGISPGVPMVLTHVSPWNQFVDVLSMNKRTLTAVTSRSSTVGAKHMSGPLGIMRILYLVARNGQWRRLVTFLVLINFGLALLNLLPIPVLDGGHILLGGVELVIRRRLPHRLAYLVQTACAVVLIGFILYVTAYDVKRSIKPFFGRSAPPAAGETASEARPTDGQ